MIKRCSHPGCATLTLGSLCIYHEPPVEVRTFPRGRPFRPWQREARGPQVPLQAKGKLAAGAVSFEGASPQ